MRSIRLGGPVVPLVSMRTATPGRVGATVVGARSPTDQRLAEVGGRGGRGPGARRARVGEVVGQADEHRQVEAGDVVAGAVDARARG